MGRVAVIGESDLVAPFGLTGAVVCPAADQASVGAALQALPADVEALILSPAAADAIGALGMPTPSLVIVVPVVAVPVEESGAVASRP